MMVKRINELLAGAFVACFFLSFSQFVLAEEIIIKKKEVKTKVAVKKIAVVKKQKHISTLVPRGIGLQALTEIDGNIVALTTEEKKLVLTDQSNKIIVNEKAASEKGTWLHKNDKWLYALWWNKTKEGKTLRIKSSSDKGKTFENEGMYIAKKGVLPNIQIADDGGDKIAVAYISERSAGYQLYFNRSLDAGQTWFENDTIINDLYTKKGKVPKLEVQKESGREGSHVSSPFMVYSNDKLILVWQETTFAPEGVFTLRIVSKTSKDFGETWINEKEVFSLEGVSPQEMNVNQLDTEILISIYLPKKGLSTFTSLDNMTNWKQLEDIPGTDKLVSASLMSSALSRSDKGLDKRVLTFTSDESYIKEKAKFFIEDAKKKTWLDVTDHVTGRKTSKVAVDSDTDYKSSFSDVGAIGKTIFFAWEDNSFNLPTILINYSMNNGETWLEKPVFINHPGTAIQRTPKFFVRENSLWLSFDQHGFRPNDAGNSPLYTTKVAEIKSNNEVVITLPKERLDYVISDEKKLEMLTKRAKEFWGYRVNKDYKKIYDFYEPLYKGLFDRATFAQTQGKIDYFSVKLGDAELITDSLAIMDTEARVSLTMVNSNAAALTDPLPPKVYKMKARWGWFYDNWYLMPQTLFDRRMDM